MSAMSALADIRAMYDLKFDSKTDSSVSRRVAELLSAAKIPNELSRDKRGLDHGASCYESSY